MKKTEIKPVRIAPQVLVRNMFNLCANLRHELDALRDAVAEIERITDGGPPNPNWPDLLGAVNNMANQIRNELAHLDERTEALRLAQGSADKDDARSSDAEIRQAARR